MATPKGLLTKEVPKVGPPKEPPAPDDLWLPAAPTIGMPSKLPVQLPGVVLPFYDATAKNKSTNARMLTMRETCAVSSSQKEDG